MGHGFGQDDWDGRYQAHPELWSGRPNRHLVTEAADLMPGTALDAGCGEGADALWLAERGWSVTAVDFSTVAVQRGATRGAALGGSVAVAIEWICADLQRWQPPTAAFSLVSAQYLHLPAAIREPIFQRLAGAVAPGGSLLIVGHDPTDMQTRVRRPTNPDVYFSADDVVASLDPGEWDVLTSAAIEAPAKDADGHDHLVHDAVVHARRRREAA